MRSQINDVTFRILYKSPAEFKGGTLAFVKVSTGKEKYCDLETEAARALVTD
jgi:hypothetical protein